MPPKRRRCCLDWSCEECRRKAAVKSIEADNQRAKRARPHFCEQEEREEEQEEEREEEKEKEREEEQDEEEEKEEEAVEEQEGTSADVVGVSGNG
ncbi:hypothetical protein niasHT_008239 [Heterodera trifolii]|uniref:Uncharacterized protein n=1 Tax=Heterodera trifolii TaxID=157864 RepID=A0ABD2LUH4_9BILA